MARSSSAVKKEPVIIPNKDIVRFTKGFIPVFGNDRDLRLVKDLGKLNRKLKEIDCKKYRDLRASKNERDMTSKMKEVMRMEDSMVATLLLRRVEKDQEAKDLVDDI